MRALERPSPLKTDEVADRLEEIVDYSSKIIEEVMENVSKIENKLKFLTFGKTRKRWAFQRNKKSDCSNNNNCKIDITCKNKCEACKTDADVNISLIKRQSAKIESEILKVKESRQGRVGQVFSMKERISGHGKAGTVVIFLSQIRKQGYFTLVINSNFVRYEFG